MGQTSSCTLRVRYQETDQMGIVYHANYLNWFEIGRTELLRQLGMEYRQVEEKGFLIPAITVSCQYIQPAKYDDLIEVRTHISQYSGVRLSFEYHIYRLYEEVLLVRGSSSHCWTDSTFKPIHLKKKWPDLHQLILASSVAN